jgi:hypothetical protein
MSEDMEHTEDPSKDEPDQATRAPGPGRPAGDVEPYGGGDEGDDPTNAAGAPPISGDEQHKGETSRPAPDDDVGVPEDVGD